MTEQWSCLWVTVFTVNQHRAQIIPSWQLSRYLHLVSCFSSSASSTTPSSSPITKDCKTHGHTPPPLLFLQRDPPISSLLLRLWRCKRIKFFLWAFIPLHLLSPSLSIIYRKPCLQFPHIFIPSCISLKAALLSELALLNIHPNICQLLIHTDPYTGVQDTFTSFGAP